MHLLFHITPFGDEIICTITVAKRIQYTMSDSAEPRFSILDLAPVRLGGTIAEAFRNTLDLARHAERWGFTRLWLAEHHSMPGIASAATAVLIGHVAGGTSTLRVGSGGRSGE